MSGGKGRACRLEHVPAALLPSDPNMYWQLTEHETALIAQLTAAYTAGSQSGLKYVKLSHPLCGEEARVTVTQMASDTISFFTALPDFSALRPRDQATLLTATAMNLILFRNAFASSLNITIDDDNLTQDTSGTPPPPPPPSTTTTVQQQKDLLHRLSQFQCSVRPFLRNDFATAAILQCAVAFDPRAPGLWDRQTVSCLQDKYIILMKHYIESQCSYLFCWHYVESMLELVQQCEDLATSFATHIHCWGDIITSLIQRLRTAQLGPEGVR